MPTLVSVFTDIANSLRSKLGTTDTFKPTEMAAAINNVSGGDELEDLEYLDRNDMSGSYDYAVGLGANNDKNFSYNGIGGYYNNIYMSGYGPTQEHPGYSGPINYWNSEDCSLICGNDTESNSYSFSEYTYFYFGSLVRNIYGAFKGQSVFNKPVVLENGITNMDSTFAGCSNFNQPITIPDSVTSINSTFAGCSNFNQPITIPDSVTSISNTFNGCSNFNQPINIPDYVYNVSFAFAGCSNFSQYITINRRSSGTSFPKINNIVGMFSGCTKFNQDIINIFNFSDYNSPIGTTDWRLLFNGCSSFNQRVYIPVGVSDLSFTFAGCNNLSDIYMIGAGGADYNARLVSVVGMVQRNAETGYNRINIWTYGIPKLFEYNNALSITGQPITWEPTPDYRGVYNAVQNVYIYNW